MATRRAAKRQLIAPKEISATSGVKQRAALKREWRSDASWRRIDDANENEGQPAKVIAMTVSAFNDGFKLDY